ncbi:hypothetical protein [uncultured Paludibaculum sp.]|uniref:hypothetical protein n=1 Tax=uncultured Paludibaculum sp. TaxID=1765020 RepID=UPI002AAB5EDD|nr:hypothetical protein [uncultured Paludibaculum sp.]
MIVAAATLITVLLAVCFAGMGGLLVPRRGNSLLSWNQSFLVGISITAAAFFPLSFLFRGAALPLVGLCLAAAGLSVLFRHPRIGFQPIQKLRGDHASLALCLLIAAIFAQFLVQNFKFSYLWDGYQIWATKAYVLFLHGAMGKQWVPPGSQERLAVYPQMIPLYQALIARIEGPFQWEALKPVFSVFFLSLLLSTFQAARTLVDRRVALAVTLLLALLPAVSTRFSVGGYADMPQAALVAGALAALLDNSSTSQADWRSPAPWLIGGIILVKNEGLLLALILCTIVIAYVLLERSTGVLARFKQHRGAIAAATLCFALRILTILWLHVDDPTYGPLDKQHLAHAYENLVTVPRLCLLHALNLREWGLFWPVFLLAAIAIVIVGNWRERAVAAGASLAVVTYISIFYFTNWDITLHIDQAFDRLMVQVAPAAALVIAAAFARLRS